MSMIDCTTFNIFQNFSITDHKTWILRDKCHICYGLKLELERPEFVRLSQGCVMQLLLNS